MAYLTENKLGTTLDIPISLASTDVRMGDWLVVASVKIVTPMRLTYSVANIQLQQCTVDTTLITSGNKIFGNLGFVYLTMRKDYTSGNPGSAGGLDALVGTSLSFFSRDVTSPVIVTDPGIYSWIMASNMQPSTDASPLISPSTSIDFRVLATGTVRLELDAS
jgi:hypothetical protein